MNNPQYPNNPNGSGEGPSSWEQPTGGPQHRSGPHYPGAQPDPFAQTQFNQPGYASQPTAFNPTAFTPAYGPPPVGPPPPGAPGAGLTPGGFGPQGPAGAPPKKRKTGLIVGLIIGAVVLVIALVVTLIVVLTRGGAGASPQSAVQTYLDALAAKDSQRVLSVVRTPPSDKLVNDEVLGKQQDSAPITDITVFEPTSNLGSNATVKATYRFGERNADVDFRLAKSGDGWIIEQGVLEVDVSNTRVPGLTLFGQDVSEDTKVYVFPGPLEWGAESPYLTAIADDDFSLGGDLVTYTSLEVGLSDEGQQAVEGAVDEYLDYCAGSVEQFASDDRPGCKQLLTAIAEDGSVRWTKPTDLSKLTYRPDYENPLEISVLGSVEWKVTYTPRRRSGTSEGTQESSLYGTVDLSKDPPTYES